MPKKVKLPKELEVMEAILDQGLEKYQRAWLAGQAMGLFRFASWDEDAIQRGLMPTHRTLATICCDVADAVIAELKRREKAR